MALFSSLHRAVPPAPELVRSLAVALALGTLMNALGHVLCVAHFAHWWQIVTCYGAYVLPVALVFRDRPLSHQLLAGLVAMVPLELAGYALGSSVPCPDNWLDPILGPRNFSLAMVVVGTPTPWLVNQLAAWVRPRD